MLIRKLAYEGEDKTIMTLNSSKALKLHYTEQRKSPRLSCFLPVTEETQKKYAIDHVCDLSLNGLGVICQKEVQFPNKDQLLEIKVLFPGKSKPLELVAQQVYQKDCFLGLKLVGSEKTAQKHLQDFYLKLCSGKTLEESYRNKPTPLVPSNGNGASHSFDENKRAAQRRELQKDFWIELTSKGAPIVKGKILDESSFGVSFLYESNPGVPLFFGKNHLFTDGLIHGENKTIRTGPAKVCHLTPLPSNNGKRVIKVGLAIGNQPQKPECQVQRVDLKKIQPEASNGILKSEKIGMTEPIPVQFQNDQGETLAGLLNTTFGEKSNKEIPVVIIPPGYGQRKESASLLVQILIHTFMKQGKDLAVLRFDFTRTVGESFTDQEGSTEGAEYLTFTFSQATEDVMSAVRFAEENIYFKASKILFLSSCFASPIVRRVLTEGVSNKISYWVNFFGVASPADWETKFSDGKDLVEEFLSGQRKGVVSFSESLVNVDRLNEDLLENNLASFEDAVREMPQINVPVTWICGEGDSSVSMEQIQKLMTLPSPAPRKMISLDAKQLHFQHIKATPSFYLITQEIFSHLHGKKVTPSVPDPADFKELHKKEWSRLK